MQWQITLFWSPGPCGPTPGERGSLGRHKATKVDEVLRPKSQGAVGLREHLSRCEGGVRNVFLRMQRILQIEFKEPLTDLRSNHLEWQETKVSWFRHLSNRLGYHARQAWNGAFLWRTCTPVALYISEYIWKQVCLPLLFSTLLPSVILPLLSLLRGTCVLRLIASFSGPPVHSVPTPSLCCLALPTALH